MVSEQRSQGWLALRQGVAAAVLVLLGAFAAESLPMRGSPAPIAYAEQATLEQNCRSAPAGSGLEALCTHGPEAPLIDAEAGGPITEAPMPERLPCTPSNGRPVVRVYYGYQKANELDLKSAPVRELILQAVAGADSLFFQAARATGGRRHVRWHTPGCELAITPVRVAVGAISLGSVIDALTNGKHLDRVGPADKLIVMLRTRSSGSFGCAGYASNAYDERPDQSNTSNTSRGFAYVHCFGTISRLSWTPAEVLAHELLHTLGAINYSAPNSTGYGHCTDESDVMCYVDAAGVQMRNVCKPTVPQQIDCKKDDYFNVSPRPGSYLATHWNTAENRALTSTRPARWIDLPEPVATVQIPRRVTGRTPVTATVNQPLGTSVTMVDLLVDGEWVGTDASAPYKFQFSPAALRLPDGKRVQVRARVYDALGREHDGPAVTVVIATADGTRPATAFGSR